MDEMEKPIQSDEDMENIENEMNKINVHEEEQEPAILSVHQLVELYQLPTIPERIAFLAAILSIHHYENNIKSKLEVDFIFQAIVFAHEEAVLSSEETVYMIKISHGLYMHATTSSFVQNDMKKSWPVMEETYELFAEWIQEYSVTTLILSLTSVAKIITYLCSTFFAQYETYQYLHKHDHVYKVNTRKIMLETPLVPLALDSSVLMEANVVSTSCSEIKVDMETEIVSEMIEVRSPEILG